MTECPADWLSWLVIQKCPEGYSCQVVSPYLIWITLFSIGLGLILYSCIYLWDKYETWRLKKYENKRRDNFKKMAE